MTASSFDPDLAERLRALDLSQAAVSATIDAEGRLGPVGGLWPKLQAAAEEQARLGLLHTIIVAEKQEGVPPPLEAPDAWPLRICRATTLPEVVDFLSREALPRQTIARHVPDTLPLLHTEVSLKTHYQLLPLLRPVKRESLPRTSGGRTDGEAEAGWGSLRAVEIRRWEEELRGESITYEPVPLIRVFQDFKAVTQQASSDVPRFVVLGPPGGGKSTLLRYLAWWCVREEAPLQVGGRPLVPAYVRLREWEAWARKEREPNYHLPDFLDEQYRGLRHAPSADLWRQWLRLGMVLLLLDGLDEMEGTQTFVDRGLKGLLQARDFGRCPLVFTCRTVSFEQHQALGKGLPVFTLAELTPEQQADFIGNYPAGHPEQFSREGLIAQLKGAPEMQPLAANPQLLSILCFVADDPTGMHLPATRGDLYDRAVDRLLQRTPRVPVFYPTGNETLPPARRRALTEEAALRMWVGMEGSRQLTFNEDTVLKALTEAARAEGYGTAPAEVADALLADLRDNSALLRGKPGGDYFFLHLTLQEFLAACALARRVDNKGWKADVPLADGRAATVAELVDRKAWDPAWHEVITLLAGRLRDPGPLLAQLADISRDDLFRHRLAVAAHALVEAGCEKAGRWADEITAALFNLWWREAGQEVNFTHWSRALPALARVNGRVNGLPLLNWLAQRLHDPNENVRDLAARTLLEMGAAAATPETLSALVQALRDPGEDVRWRTVMTLRAMGATAATPEILATLVQNVLHNPHGREREYAIEALEAMGAAAAIPEILATLGEALHDPDEDMRGWAVTALEVMGAAAATPEILATLVQSALHDPDKDVRWRTVRAVRAMRAIRGAAAPPEVMAILVQALHDSDKDVRAVAAEALGALGAAAATPEILVALDEALRDPDEEIRFLALSALGEMGAAAATPEILVALDEALRDPDEDICFLAFLALEEMGAAAATPEILVALDEALGGPAEDVCRQAAEALEEMGAAAATPEILVALCEALRDPAEDVRRQAAEALRAMGTAAATPEILATLVQALRDRKKGVREQAGRALEAVFVHGVRVFQHKKELVVRRVVELAAL